MSEPSPHEQIQFLVNLQRLVDEGLFVASYKFALLLSLADLSIEKGDESLAALALSSREIGEKFIQYYWRQAVPYPSATTAKILQQNTGKQAAVLSMIRDARRLYGDSLATVASDRHIWPYLVRRVAEIVRVMPLWKLQTMGPERLDFLYENVGAGTKIELRPGVAYCFRKFHPLISDLVRGAWVRYVRQQNLDILGEATDLNEFLFGSERISLAVVRPVLLDIQNGRCFYCRSPLTPINTHVDHLVAWARYPVDLGHNFVLADSRCNQYKRDRLPAYEHLAAWTERNARFSDQIGEALTQRGIVSELAASNCVTEWAYAQTEAVRGLTWLRKDEMVPLHASWRELFKSVPTS
jgi:5-methylcytosine-specific restriction endonuclease McrA